MIWRIEISDRAAMERESAFLRFAARDLDTAARWLEGLIRAVAALAEFPGPRAYAIARESDRYGVEVRRMLYFGPGKRRGKSVYRVLFHVIEPDASGEAGIIRILHFYHGAQNTDPPPVNSDDQSS